MSAWLFFQCLWISHQEFGTYGDMKMRLDTLCIVNWMAFIWIGLCMLKKKYEYKQLQTFNNIKRANMVKMNQTMKRLQNPRMMDDDRIDMENIKYQGEIKV